MYGLLKNNVVIQEYVQEDNRKAVKISSMTYNTK